MPQANNSSTPSKAVETRFFSVADLAFAISFAGYDDGFRMLKSFRPFERKTADKGSLLFTLTIDDSTRPVAKERRERIREFETGNGTTIVDRLQDGGYQYIIKDINAAECALLIADKDFSHCACALRGNVLMRSFGLNNAIMLVYAFAGASKGTVLMHASVARQGGYGYAFIAKSGTGKSTQVSNWLKYIPGCDMMNDDNPVVRVVDEGCCIEGRPWRGKSPCYRAV